MTKTPDADRMLRVASRDLDRLRERFDGLVRQASPSAQMAHAKSIESVSSLIQEAQRRIQLMRSVEGRRRILAYRAVCEILESLKTALSTLDVGQRRRHARQNHDGEGR